MPTIAQAQTQVKSAKTELEKAKLEAEQREADIKAAKIESQKRFQEKTRIGTISSQLRIAGEVGAGAVAGEIPRRRRLARKEFQQTQQKISFAEEELGGFQEQLSERELEIGGVETQIGRAVEQEKIQKELEQDIKSATEAFDRGSLKPRASKRVVRFFKQLIAARGSQRAIRELKAQGLEPIFGSGKLVGFEDIVRQQSIALSALPESVSTLLPPTKLDPIIAQSLLPVQSIAPITSFTTLQAPKEGLGGVTLKRTELEAIRQQSFPLETTGAISDAGLEQIGFAERIGVPKQIRQTLGITPFEGRLGELSTGTVLQSAVFLSFAGVKVPIGKLKVPLREVEQPSFVEVQQPLIISGKPLVVSSFRITREVSPPTIIQAERGLLGVSDISNIQPPKLQVTTTPFKALDKVPVLTLTTKGGKVGQLDILTGTSRPIDISGLGGLRPTQRFLFQRFAEDIAGGRPVALERVPKLLRKDLDFDLGELQSFKLGKVDIGKQPTQFDLFPIKQAGKRTTKFETLSQFEKVTETDQFQLFKGAIFFKETTKPFARATGKTPKLPGIVIRRKEIVSIGEPSDVGEVIFRGGKVTPLEKTFAKQFQQQELKLLPKPPPPPKVKKVTLKEQKPTKAGGISSLLFGVSGRVSDRSISGFSIDFARGFEAGGITKPIQAKEQGQLDFGKQFIIEQPRTLGEQFSIIQQGLILEQRQFPVQKERAQLKFKELLIQRKELRQVEKLTQRPKQVSKLRLVQRQIQKTPRPGRARPFRLVSPSPKALSPLLFDLPKVGFKRIKKKRKKKGKKLKPPIRPSLTGIITEGIGLPETTIVEGVDIGVLPKQLRGLPKKKTKKRKKR